MKNFFKLGFVALALSLSVVACNSEKKADATDSPAVDTNAMAPDTTKADTTKADTTKAAADTTKAAAKH
ncbi:hypothetical protein [Pedobacter sp. Hv1]|uniref:hypothetical protein n=1 Tax=Pedobacter sp. Hv1 TaxID=1740090 RepID=UPI0006D892F1|nr:hypothetical protein [Pedobacter sp. Hv1]KQC01238.1 hypothetical protein AQF98_11305 [Pedobacter sp. Hv1]